MRYGDNKTWHQTGYIDVETDEKGNVVSVWFRCLLLPFKQTIVGGDRIIEMNEVYGVGRAKTKPAEGLAPVVKEDVFRGGWSSKPGKRIKINAIDYDYEGDER